MKGFTLLEVVVTMIMTSFILIALYGAYTSNAESIQWARESAREYQTARIVLDLMRKDLQGAVSWDPAGLVGEKRELDGRRADQLQVTTSAAHAALQDVRSGLYRASYVIVRDEKEGEAYVLFRNQEAVVGEGVSVGKQSYELTRTISSLSFEYADQEGRLFETWGGAGGGGAERLPSLVRIRLTLRGPTGRETVFSTAVHPELGGSSL